MTQFRQVINTASVRLRSRDTILEVVIEFILKAQVHGSTFFRFLAHCDSAPVERDDPHSNFSCISSGDEFAESRAWRFGEKIYIARGVCERVAKACCSELISAARLFGSRSSSICRPGSLLGANYKSSHKNHSARTTWSWWVPCFCMKLCALSFCLGFAVLLLYHLGSFVGVVSVGTHCYRSLPGGERRALSQSPQRRLIAGEAECFSAALMNMRARAL